MLDRIMTALGILRYGTDRNNGIRKAFVDGHYYSPIVDTKALRQEEERVWPKLPQNCTLGGQLFGGGSLWLKKLVDPQAATVSE